MLAHLVWSLFVAYVLTGLAFFLFQLADDARGVHEETQKVARDKDPLTAILSYVLILVVIVLFYLLAWPLVFTAEENP